PHALTAINAVAQQFPMTLGTTIGFECPLSLPLSAVDANADFFLRISGTWGQSLLAGQPQPPPVLEQLQSQPELCPPGFACLWDVPTWQRIRQFAQRWAEPTSLLQKAINDIWLEFDVVPGASHLPIPSSFFGVKSPGLPSLDWVSQTALPMLLGTPLSPQAAATLHRCFAAIPASAKVFQIGALSGRVASPSSAPALRLYVQDLRQAQVPSLLNRLAWSGDGDLLTQLLARVCPGQATCSLQLEIQDTLSPVIAIECAFPNRAGWQSALNRLMITGFCTPERAQALLAYPGYVRAQDAVAPFPKLLARWSAQLAPYRECLLVKRLAYLKFTYRPGHPLLVKAYMGVSPTWVDARYLDADKAIAASSPSQESVAIQLCKDLIQQLDYGEVDVDELFAYQRSQKSRWLNKALETMCVGG
ncbi:MAG: hypothetical protein AAFZ49_06145, partial [Cyanobacteria bacterium J06659_2]